MSQQNPIIPHPLSAIEVDAAILDIQTKLDLSLPWLSNPYGRAYQLIDQTKEKQRVYLPYVYKGKDRDTSRYFNVSPDNDKMGQCLFFVEEERYGNSTIGGYGWLSYDMSIIFSVNLELINSSLLETELFTSHLIADVRNALIRQNLGRPYKLSYNNTKLKAQDVWSEFDIELSTVEKAPLQHFRMNFTLELKEDCTGLPYDPCATLLSKIIPSVKNGCILPTYVFSDPVVQSNVTPLQILDLTTWLCSTTPIVPKSLALDGVGGSVFTQNGGYVLDHDTSFTLSVWVKIDSYPDGAAHVFNSFTSSPISRGYFAFVRANGAIGFRLYSTGSNFLLIETPAGSLNNGVWQHLCFTYDGGGLSGGLNVYVNGVAVSKAIVNDTLLGGTTVRQDLPLLVSGSADGRFFIDGKIHQLRAWDSPLSSAQVLIEYNNRGLQDPVSPSNVNAWCACGDYATFGVNAFAMPDLSGSVTGFQTRNVLSGALSTDVPT